ncbi:gated mechanosensitive channel [Basidiobolus meristosporus CBS 931.73]|uniref:Gated mechanosensitive channel n=1 Tax=Basidiobolus meristosporus CBS 931.73 TaxID=1314790 RepID=A0A1Y1XWD8_9FUNG|nr:gated mechanosensitive channel [Basidiobolus meristosporus CBS 931.73]|eukprot:ORX89995.1 gated mechanosensitive channel [Basidiobolus meristosporus CBS 931.73]
MGLLQGTETVTKTAKGIWHDFKDFIDNGNVLGLAVGLVTGGAFTSLINSLVSDIITPPFGLLLGKANFENLFVILKHGNSINQSYETIDQAQKDGAVTWNYGRFIQVISNFIILSFSLFWAVRFFQIFQKDEIIKSQVNCKYCRSSINKKSIRCKFCTSWLDEREQPR